MVMRRVLWGVIAVFGVLVLVGGGVLAWLVLRPHTPEPQLVVSDANNTLRMLADGRDEQVLASDVQTSQFLFPAISPDGSQVAYVAADGDSIALFTQHVASGERRQVYTNAAAEPFDIGWSPDSRYLVFLAPGPGQLVLLVVPADGSSEPVVVAAGSSVYFAWREDSSQLAIHVNGHSAQQGQVLLYAPGEAEPTLLSSDPGLFAAPAFSRDGSAVFYAAQPRIESGQLSYETLGANIVRADVSGQNSAVLASEKQAALRLVRSPVSDAIAYATQRFNADGSFEWGELKLVDDQGRTTTLSHSDQHVDAFFWSPDGAFVAYLAYAGAYTPNSPRTWNVVDVRTSEVRELATFTPSTVFANLNVYFDAYLYGFNPWSPNSDRLAYAADDGIYTINLSKGQAEKAGDGVFALWTNP